MTKLRILRSGDYPGLSRCLLCNQESLSKRDKSQKRCDNGGRGQKNRPMSQENDQPLEAGKGNEMNYPLETPEKMLPCQHPAFRLLTSRAIR